MLWSFRALATFSLDSSRILNVSTANEDKLPSPRAPSTTPTIRVTRPDFEAGRSTPQPWLCSCGYQQTDFCPYCDYEQTILLERSIVIQSLSTPPDIETSGRPGTQLDSSNSTARARKLRKVRRDYQQLQYEVLDVQAVIAARPDSVLSTHSRTPLLPAHLPSNPNYLPLPPDRRTPNKLEKRDKRRRSVSLPDSAYSTLVPPPDPKSRGRAIRSKSFLSPKIREALGPRPKPISSSINTDALVSLAWTGEALPPVKSSELLLSSYDGSASYFGSSRPSSVVGVDSRSGSSSGAYSPISGPSSNKRRSVLRMSKLHAAQARAPKRPWTLAMVITDDGITDERLVDDLEDMRIKDGLAESVIPDPYPLGLCPPPFYQTQLYDSYAEYPFQAGEVDQGDTSPSSDSSWNAARQALLLCRELVRTERRYLASLKTLITNGTSTPPPTLMLPYLPGLITASDDLLQLMEQNPSVQGVSEAFLACEFKMKESFVNWCNVVGQFFNPDEGSKNKIESDETAEPTSPGKLRSPRSRATSMRTRSAESGLSVVIPEPNKIRRNTKARPAVRDLAILPTQRIMRYVLLFKELYSFTPTTLPSFSVVEKALQAAESIAEMANNAQGHSAFRQPPSRVESL